MRTSIVLFTWGITRAKCQRAISRATSSSDGSTSMTIAKSTYMHFFIFLLSNTKRGETHGKECAVADAKHGREDHRDRKATHERKHDAAEDHE